MDEDKKTVDLKESMADMMANLPYLIQYQVIIAQLQRTRFLVLKVQGFTDEQALELCKKIV